MRLHGGYFKKDAENKKSEKKDTSGPPLQTASVSVRALIEEKIINKRITNPPTPAPEEQPRPAAPPLFPLNAHADADSAKVSSFVVPAPPAAEKARRHSDAETFTRPSSAQQEAEAIADLILKREKVGVKRTASDPGQPASQIIQLQGADSFTLTYQSEDGDYLSPGLHEEVFTQVQDTMLLQGVDAQQLATIQFQADSLLREQNDHQLQDIANLEDYTNLQENVVVQSPSYQSSHSVNQELQAVLDSPLPESLAEFSTFHSTTNMDLPSPSYQTHSPAQYAGSPHPSLAAQSPLQSPLVRHDSPGFAYPTPPASHEGQSPCFGQNTILPMVSPKQNEFGQVVSRDIDEPPQASSPLSAAFFTSTMSSSAEVEEALEEVLPGETISNDDIYPLTNSPTPQSPLSVGLTPVASPLSNIANTSSASPRPSANFTPSPSNAFSMSPHFPLQSQMMPNSDDPLLSSSPKDFATAPRKKFEFNGLPLKVVNNNGLLELNGTNFAGILVDSNGEIKFIQTGGHAFAGKSFVLSGTTLVASQEIGIKEDDGKGGQKVHKVLKTVQIPAKQLHTHARPKSFGDNPKKEENTGVFLSPTT